MQNSDLILQGVQLMLIGMGMVFVFLSILVVVTSLMQKLLLQQDIEDTIAGNGSHPNDEEVAAISIAIHQFRNKKSQE